MIFQRLAQATLAATATWLMGRAMAQLTDALETQARTARDTPTGDPRMASGARHQSVAADTLVACPVCGVHVPRSTARACSNARCPYPHR